MFSRTACIKTSQFRVQPNLIIAHVTINSKDNGEKCFTQIVKRREENGKRKCQNNKRVD